MFDKVKFKAAVVLSGKSMEDVANRLNINVSTLYRKINNDGFFTRCEIEVLTGFLSIRDPMSIFFAKELA